MSAAPANDTAPVHSGATPTDIAAANARCGAQAPRLPPTRLHDEMYILRALIGAQANLGSIADVLRPKHFADPANGVVYRWMRMLVRKGMRPADVQFLSGFEGLRSDLETEAKAPDYLAVVLEHRLPEGAFLDRPVRLAAVRVLEAWLGRQLIDITDRIDRANGLANNDAWAGGEDVRASVTELLATLEEVAEKLRWLRGEARYYD